MSNNTEALKLALEALARAQNFIRNGVELGFIRMPDADCPDPAHETPHVITRALASVSAALAQAEQTPPTATPPITGTPAITQAEQAQPAAWREAVQRLVTGFEHVSGIARQWEPDHSSGADRAKWARATEACADVVRLLAAPPAAPQPTREFNNEGDQIGGDDPSYRGRTAHELEHFSHWIATAMPFDKRAGMAEHKAKTDAALQGWMARAASQDFAECLAASEKAAAPQPQAAQQAVAPWQPIQTAPRDGSLFLCWVSAVRYGETDEGQPYQQDASQVDFCSWRDGPPYLPGHGYFDPCCGQIADSQDVTHWMPLPPSPFAAAPTQAAPLVALTQAAQARDDAIWYDIRATLRAVIEDGHSADLDEVDAKRLLDLIDAAPPAAPPKAEPEQPVPLHEVMRRVRRLQRHAEDWCKWYADIDVLQRNPLPRPPADTERLVEDLDDAIRRAAPPAAPQPTDLERECAAVDFLLRHVGLDPEHCRTEGGAINLGRVRSLLEDCTPQPETWSLYVAGMIGTYLKWPVDDTRIPAIAGIIERRRKFDAAPPAAPQPDAEARSICYYRQRTFDVECMLAALIDKIAPGLDSGDILADAKTALAAAPQPQAAPLVALTQAAQDVLAERRRQVEVEGWTPEHDDEHADGSLAVAAACYVAMERPDGMCPGRWPWRAEWWKPKDRRSDLVRGTALALAEIERLDRAHGIHAQEGATQAQEVKP